MKFLYRAHAIPIHSKTPGSSSQRVHVHSLPVQKDEQVPN